MLSNGLLISLLRRIPVGAKQTLKRQYWKLRILSGRGIVTAGPLTNKYREALLKLQEEHDGALGDYFEFGVFNGTSLACMYEVTRELGLKQLRLFGFDSFQGLPETAGLESDGLWSGGSFHLDYDYTRKWLSSRGIDWDRVFLVKGWYKDTLNQQLVDKFKLTRASVIMIDCDLYSSAKEALTFCSQLIGDRAVILFDDWFPLADRNMGERKAFDEFMLENPELSAEDLGSYDDTSKVFYLQRKSAR